MSAVSRDQPGRTGVSVQDRRVKEAMGGRLTIWATDLVVVQISDVPSVLTETHMLLVTDPANDPTLEQMSLEARTEWLNAVGHCVTYRTDLLTPHDLQKLTAEIVDEWEQVELAKRLPFGHVRVLGRPDLWDFGAGSY
jgi:hypothetical protein